MAEESPARPKWNRWQMDGAARKTLLRTRTPWRILPDFDGRHCGAVFDSVARTASGQW